MLFTIECGHHDSHKEVQYEETSKDDEEHKEQGPCLGLILDWLKVDANRVDAFVHDVHPSFGGRDLEQGRHGLEHIIEILISIDPFSSWVQAIEFRLDEVLREIDHLIRELISENTAEKGPLEIVDADDTAYQKEHQGDDHHVEKAWYGHDQSLDANLETFISADDSQGPKDTKKSEDLDNLHLAARDCHLDDWDNNNDEIDNVPSNSQIAVLSIEKKTIAYDFQASFENKEGSQHNVRYVENLGTQVAWIVKRVIKG